IVTLILGTVVTVQSLSARTSSSRSVERTFSVLRTTEMLLDQVNDSELALTEFIITGDPQFLEPFDRARESIPGTLERLRDVTSDRPAAQAQLDELAPLLHSAIEKDEKEIVARRAGATAFDLQPRLLEGKLLLERSANILENIRDDT